MHDLPSSCSLSDGLNCLINIPSAMHKSLVASIQDCDLVSEVVQAGISVVAAFVMFEYRG